MRIYYYKIDKQHVVFKIHFGNTVGYTDYKAYSNLGYIEVDSLLKDLKHSYRHFIISNCYLDGFFFSKLKPNKTIVKNHSLYIKDTTFQMSSKYIKAKLCGKLDEDIKLVFLLAKKYSFLRLDANEKYDKKTFKKFLKKVSPIKEQIDYIEDPVPFDLAFYQNTNRKINVHIDHRSYFDSMETKLCSVYRPMLKAFDERSRSSIYAGQHSSLLEGWQCLAHLFLFGRVDKYHGTFNPSLIDDYEFDGSKIRLKEKSIKDEYKKLESLVWTSLRK